MATMKKTLVDIDQYRSNIKKVKKLKVVGKVIQVVGLVIEAQVQGVAVGELCKLIISPGYKAASLWQNPSSSLTFPGQE